MRADFLRDIVRGLKGWRRTPGAALLVILGLGLSGGALLTLVTVFNALFWRELPVLHAHELVGVSGTDRRAPDWESVGIPVGLFASLEKTQDIFDGFAGFLNLQATAVVGDTSQRLSIEAVSGRYFQTIGLSAARGRVLEQNDSRNQSPVAVLSFRCWQSRFHADPDVIGRTLRLQGQPLTVVGVAPPGFSGLEVGIPSDAWVPAELAPRLQMNQSPSLVFFASLVGRLRSGVTLEQARLHVESLWPTARQDGADDVAGSLPAARDDVLAMQPRVESAARGFSDVRAFYRPTLVLLLLSGAIAVLLCCANLSGLLLARWSTKETDLAVQIALGATRARLVAQIIGESLCLSTLAVMFSLPLAWWSAKVITLLLWNEPDVPPLELGADYRVIGVIVGMAGIVALCVGVLPASRVWFANFTLTRNTRELPGRSVTRWGRRLSTAQVALSLPLLVTAWLVAANLHRLENVNTGFQAGGVTVVNLIGQGGAATGTDSPAYIRRLASALSEVPGIEAAALSQSEPVSGIFGDLSRVPARGDAGQLLVKPFVEAVSPAYFKTLNIPLLAGRDFTWADDRSGRDVAIISAGLARALFEGSNPIGQRLRLGGRTEPNLEIVGLAADAKLADPHDADQMFVFTPLLQQPARFLELLSPAVLLKSPLPPSAVERAARRAIVALGRDEVDESHSLLHTLNAVLVRERLMRLGSVYLAGLTTLLVFVGLYAVMNLSIVRRIPEIGLRVSLGASAHDIRRMVFGEALVTATIGLALGLPCAFLSGRLLGSTLTLVEAHDAVAFCAAIATILAVTVLSVVAPLRRASRVTPLEALNSQ